MKTKNILLFVLALFISLSWVNAEYRIYTTVGDFEKAKWNICEAATDGCNNYFMSDGKVMGWTRMACKPNFKPEWTCTKFKENSITTMGITTTSIKTTKEVQTTDLIETTSIETTAVKILSQNDQNFYETIQKRLDSKYKNTVKIVLKKYKINLSKYSSIKAMRINENLIKKVDAVISKILMKYPQDIALPTKANNIYLTYTLLKFELMQLEY